MTGTECSGLSTERYAALVRITRAREPGHMETEQPSGNPVPRAGAEPGSGPPGSGPPGPAPRPRRKPPACAPARASRIPPPGWGGAGPQPAPRGAQPRIQVGSPDGVLAVVPHLLGFHPALSFVVIGAAGRRQQVELGFRYDLPDPPDAEAAAEIAGHAVAVLTERRVSTVIGVGYGPGRLVTPVADALAAALPARLRLRELLRVEDGRYWSYLCGDVDCCPPEGTPFDYPSHPVAAAMTVAGLAAYPDRVALASTLAPLTGPDAHAMDQAIERASARAQALVGQAREGGGHPLRLAINSGRAAVREAIGVYRAGERITEPDAFAALLVGLVNLAVRDDAWARMVPEHREAHLRLWADLVRRASGPWLPAPASLLAFTAWQAGDGTLANVALDRALDADPDYSMARLLREILAAGVPPAQARLPMTPEEVEDSYARAESLPTTRQQDPLPRRRPARKPPGARRGDSPADGGDQPASGDSPADGGDQPASGDPPAGGGDPPAGGGPTG
jgi:hypothetical protein